MRPIALLLLLVGCTASKASIQIVNADDGLRRAREYDADRLAEYEYVMAMRYLEKAKEEAGHSEFRVADALARQSAEWSDRAIIFVEKRGRSDLQLDDFSEDTMSPTADAPAPAPAPAPVVPTGLEDILGPTAPLPTPEPAPPPMPMEDLDDILNEPLPGEPTPEPPAPEPQPEDFLDLEDEP
ncbi:MAG: DUF4398 domain-containing protein [Alphaproteobacteria bacterium]|nr:DUF4398 domain-containing protein [Alphaproteobacteria bacterium]